MSNKLIQKTLSGIGIAENLKFFYDFESYSGDYVMPAFHQENPYSGKVVNYDSSFHDEAMALDFFMINILRYRTHLELHQKMQL